MNNKEIVQQGLQVRKDVRAAEIRAEKFRAEAVAINDARFRDQMRDRQAKSAWQCEREDLQGMVNRQRIALTQMREEIGEMRKRERDARQVRIALSIAKAAALFVLLIFARDHNLIVAWLNDSLMAFSISWLLIAITALTCRKF